VRLLARRVFSPKSSVTRSGGASRPFRAWKRENSTEGHARYELAVKTANGFAVYFIASPEIPHE